MSTDFEVSLDQSFNSYGNLRSQVAPSDSVINTRADIHLILLLHMSNALLRVFNQNLNELFITAANCITPPPSASTLALPNQFWPLNVCIPNVQKKKAENRVVYVLIVPSCLPSS